jgi:hypothetical protein
MYSVQVIILIILVGFCQVLALVLALVASANGFAPAMRPSRAMHATYVKTS